MGNLNLARVAVHLSAGIDVASRICGPAQHTKANECFVPIGR